MKKYNIVKKLTAIADRLDLAGLKKEADAIDAVATTFANVIISHSMLSVANIQNSNIDTAQEHEDIVREKFEKRRRIKYEISPEEKLLAKHDIIPLDTSKGEDFTSKIGEGVSGSVFSAVYKGKNVAAKVSVNAGEIDIWKKILEASANAPDDIKKHIPKIYDFILEKDEFGEDIAIILMEMLSPLDGHSFARLFGKYSGGTRPVSISNIAKDEQLLYNASLYALTNYGDPQDAPYLHKELLSVKFVGSDQEIKKGIQKAVDSFGKEKGLNDSEKYNTETLRKIVEEVYSYLHGASVGGSLPKESESAEAQPWLKDTLGIRDLYATLEYLKSKGINWKDVNISNVMMRKETGEPVIIDVGMYTI